MIIRHIFQGGFISRCWLNGHMEDWNWRDCGNLSIEGPKWATKDGCSHRMVSHGECTSKQCSPTSTSVKGHSDFYISLDASTARERDHESIDFQHFLGIKPSTCLTIEVTKQLRCYSQLRNDIHAPKHCSYQ